MMNVDELKGDVEMEPFHQAAIDVSPGIVEEQNQPTEGFVEIHAAKDLQRYCGNRNSFAFSWIEHRAEFLSERARVLHNFGKNGDEEESSSANAENLAAQSSSSSANAENLAAQSSILQIPPPSNDDDNTYIITRSLLLRTKVAPREQERPFSCPQCERSFLNHHHLGRHQLDVHSGLRPFVCKKCGSAFKRKSDMLKHSTFYCKPKKRIQNFQVDGDATKEGEQAMAKEEAESEPMKSNPKTFIDEYKRWLVSAYKNAM